MKHMAKIFIATFIFSVGFSGHAVAMMIDASHFDWLSKDPAFSRQAEYAGLYGLELDGKTTLDMCKTVPAKRWSAEKWGHFEKLFESQRQRNDVKFPVQVKQRWSMKWNDREDWSQFKHSQRPFQEFHLKHHFHNYSQPSVVPVPAAVWLFGSGLLGLIAVARRKYS